MLDQGFYAAQKEPRKERKSSPILPHPDLPDKESLYCKDDEKNGNPDPNSNEMQQPFPTKMRSAP